MAKPNIPTIITAPSQLHASHVTLNENLNSPLESGALKMIAH